MNITNQTNSQLNTGPLSVSSSLASTPFFPSTLMHDQVQAVALPAIQQSAPPYWLPYFPQGNFPFPAPLLSPASYPAAPASSSSMDFTEEKSSIIKRKPTENKDNSPSKLTKRIKHVTRLPYPELQSMFHENLGYFDITYDDGIFEIPSWSNNLLIGEAITLIQTIFNYKIEDDLTTPADVSHIRRIYRDRIKDFKNLSESDHILTRLFDVIIKINLHEIDSRNYKKISSLINKDKIYIDLLKDLKLTLSDINQFKMTHLVRYLHPVSKDILERVNSFYAQKTDVPKNEYIIRSLTRLIKKIEVLKEAPPARIDLTDDAKVSSSSSLPQANPVPLPLSLQWPVSLPSSLPRADFIPAAPQIFSSSSQPIPSPSSQPKPAQSTRLGNGRYLALEAKFREHLVSLGITFNGLDYLLPEECKRLGFSNVITEIQKFISTELQQVRPARNQVTLINAASQARKANLPFLNTKEHSLSVLFDAIIGLLTFEFDINVYYRTVDERNVSEKIITEFQEIKDFIFQCGSLPLITLFSTLLTDAVNLRTKYFSKRKIHGEEILQKGNALLKEIEVEQFTFSLLANLDAPAAFSSSSSLPLPLPFQENQ